MVNIGGFGIYRGSWGMGCTFNARRVYEQQQSQRKPQPIITSAASFIAHFDQDKNAEGLQFDSTKCDMFFMANGEKAYLNSKTCEDYLKVLANLEPLERQKVIKSITAYGNTFSNSSDDNRCEDPEDYATADLCEMFSNANVSAETHIANWLYYAENNSLIKEADRETLVTSFQTYLNAIEGRSQTTDDDIGDIIFMLTADEESIVEYIKQASQLGKMRVDLILKQFRPKLGRKLASHFKDIPDQFVLFVNDAAKNGNQIVIAKTLALGRIESEGLDATGSYVGGFVRISGISQIQGKVPTYFVIIDVAPERMPDEIAMLLNSFD